MSRSVSLIEKFEHRDERNIKNLILVFMELVQEQVKKRGVATMDLVMKVKFGLSEKHTKFEKKIFLIVLTNQLIYLVNVKSMRNIFSNHVCFSKSLNSNTY